jgi:cis-L-3-hydroxyproline dehydratase
MLICDLLGGRTTASLPVISSIHAGSSSDMHARVASHRARGYRGHSIKLAADSPAADVASIVACLPDARANEFFIADAHGGLTVEPALRTLGLLPSGLDFVLEAPCATYRECLSL